MVQLNNSDGAQSKIEQLEAELTQKNNLISRLKSDNEILRSQGKDARRQVRRLEHRLGLMQQSRWYKLGCRIKAVLSGIKRIWLIPFRWLHMAEAPSVSEGLTPPDPDREAASSLLEEPGTAHEPHHELALPQVHDSELHDIFDIDGSVTTVTVVVCIHNAPYDVEECLLSLWKNRSFPYQIVLVDDGSDELTANYIKKYAGVTHSTLIRNDTAKGYTIAANQGLHTFSSDYYILLNSDTIVTYGWVEKMLTCFRRHPQTGIVSPLSNAASYQSVPDVHDSATGDWKINTLPAGITTEMMGQLVEKESSHIYPCLPVLNGFCFMISQRVIDAIGYLDEDTFPKGYGEEVDYCLRTAKAGFELRVADDTYIFHEKSKSFTHRLRKELGAESKEKLKAKHGEREYLSLDSRLSDCQELTDIRRRIRSRMEQALEMPVLHKKIAFLLTARGGSGGANSVCQEVMGMRRLGIEAYVINSSNYMSEFEGNYPELVPYVRYFAKKSEKSLCDICSEFDIIIGTIFTTVTLLKKVQGLYPHKVFGYYIQDYEPLFFTKEEPYWQEAYASYSLLDQMCMFAKTAWIADTVHKNHGKKVYLVEPGIDIHLYNPFVINQKPIAAPISITAMLRPKTERRNPQGTLRILKRLKEKYRDEITVLLFGCEDKEIKDMGEAADFEYTNYGILKRWEVARLLSHSTIFLDMSTYQAFGRTGLESMCLGCVAVVPEEGGVSKYAIDDENAIVVDTLNENDVLARMCDILDHRDKLLKLQAAGIKTARSYNIMNAVLSEIAVLNQFC